MSNVSTFVKSIIMLASQAGMRDNGTRLVMVQKTVDDCAASVTHSKEKYARLDTLLAEVKKQPQGRPDEVQFLADVKDTIIIKKRHIGDLAA
ncbi:MAG: hypothetical protein WBD95_02610 [Xanthobacteraceae bacterium]